MYNVDFKTFIQILIPNLIRKTKLIALLTVLFYPFVVIFDKFKAVREFVLLQINCTGQVIYLERLLNIIFGDGVNTITITDGSFTIPFFLANKEESYVVYFHNKEELYQPVYLQNKEEYSSDVDFIINIPTERYNYLLTHDLLERLKAIVNRYKIEGKTFLIINY